MELLIFRFCLLFRVVKSRKVSFLTFVVHGSICLDSKDVNRIIYFSNDISFKTYIKYIVTIIAQII